MKKIAVTTLHGYHNYGNKLQNFALHQVINQLGFNVDTIDISININNKNVSI